MTENTEPKKPETKTNSQTQITSYRKELIIGAAVVIGVLAIASTIILFIYNSTPKVDYQPAVACDTFTVNEATELLGAGAFNSNTDQPILSGNTAISRCGYTDGNADSQKVRVAAIIVRSGINDKGVAQNKTEFAGGIPAQAVEIVKDLGDNAYFNQTNGQFNVLKGRNWFIFSYGPGAAPETNSVEDGIKLAQKVLN